MHHVHRAARMMDTAAEVARAVVIEIRGLQGATTDAHISVVVDATTIARGNVALELHVFQKHDAPGVVEATSVDGLARREP